MITTADICKQAEQETRKVRQAKQQNLEGDNAMLVGLGCLTAICGALLVISATISAMVWLARWAMGW